jgi:hypothetical protein
MPLLPQNRTDHFHCKKESCIVISEYALEKYFSLYSWITFWESCCWTPQQIKEWEVRVYFALPSLDKEGAAEAAGDLIEVQAG